MIKKIGNLRSQRNFVEAEMRIVHDKTVITKSIWREKDDDDKTFCSSSSKTKRQAWKKKKNVVRCRAADEHGVSLFFCCTNFLDELGHEGGGDEITFFFALLS